jgi:hypothetical protein
MRAVIWGGFLARSAYIVFKFCAPPYRDTAPSCPRLRMSSPVSPRNRLYREIGYLAVGPHLCLCSMGVFNTMVKAPMTMTEGSLNGVASVLRSHTPSRTMWPILTMIIHGLTLNQSC